jgi:hypothetical protein
MCHVRANAIAYCALFVALGGTSYAAVGIPRNSVGTSQLRNGSVTAAKLANGAITTRKLNHKSIAGSVVFWARIGPSGQVLASSEPAQTSGWTTGRGTITFRARLSSNCFALANASSGFAGFVSILSGGSVSAHDTLGVFMAPARAAATGPGPLPIDVAEICP